MEGKKNYLKERALSFKYAFRGIRHVVKHEPNFRIHIWAAILVFAAGIILHISITEWLFVILTIASVMVAEILNSAVEKIVDLIMPEQNPKAGIIKDISAGAVLIMAIFAAIAGMIIFIPKIIDLL